MKSYQYKLDELVKTWKSTHFVIEAKNKREADKLAKQICKNEEFPDNNWVEYDQFDDKVQDCDSFLFDEKGNEIATI